MNKAYIYRVIDNIKLIRRNKRFGIDHHLCDIPLSVNIPDTTKFAHHAIGVIIGGGTRLGENIRISNYVNIGVKRGNNDGLPTIGNNVTIYPYAGIYGNVKVGDNSVVGSYSLVITDVPENSLVYGIPAKVIKKLEASNEQY